MDNQSGWLGMPTITGDPDLDMLLAKNNLAPSAAPAQPVPLQKLSKKLVMPKQSLPKKIDRTSNTEDQKTIDALTNSTTELMGNTTKDGTSKNDVNIQTKNASAGSKDNVYDQQKLNDTLGFLREQPEYKDQQAAMDDLNSMISMEASQKPKKAFDPWVQPLMMLSDAQTGSNFMAHYKEPTDPNDKMKLLLKYKDDLSKRKAEATKTLLAGLKASQTGSLFDRLLLGDRNISGLTTTQGTSQNQQNTNTNRQQHTDEQGTKQMQGSGFQRGKGGLDLTPYEEAFDKNSAKDSATWAASGGPQKLDENIDLLSEAVQEIKEAKKQGGMGVSGSLQGLLSGTGLQPYVSPKSAAIQQKINKVITSDLKTAVGGRVTNYEMQRLQQLHFDPRLTEAENLQVLEPGLQTLKDIRERNKAQSKYVDENRTLRGFQNSPEAQGAPKGFKPGQIMMKGGVPYRRQKDGSWVPAK